MEKNILYQNLDMLSVMEASEDKSKDFILVFMPYNMGGTVGEAALRPVILSNQSDAYEESNLWRYLDYGATTFYDEDKADAYITLIKKVIQNAGRVLDKNGVFCFGFPRNFDICTRNEAEKPQIKLLLQQVFENCTVIDVPNFSVDAKPGIVDSDDNKYDLYICSNGRNFSEGYNEIYDLKLPAQNKIQTFLTKYGNILNAEIPNKKGWFRSEYLTAIRLVNMLLISELRSKEYIERACELKNKELSKVTISPEEVAEEEKIEAELRKSIAEIAADKDSYVPLAESLMLTYCEVGDRALFPYDRNGQYAAIADTLGINWVSLYKESFIREEAYAYAKSIEKCKDAEKALRKIQMLFEDKHTNFLGEIESERYIERTVAPEHEPVKYEDNYLTSAKDANLLKNKFTRITSDIIETAAACGLEETGDMEDAIHAVISLAVKGQKGNITSDTAKEWYGDGWDDLSDSCKIYLQTALAFDELSKGGETTDCAPIAIEFCRALELEANSAFVKPFATSCRQSIEERNGNKIRDDERKLIEMLKTIYGEGEIGKQNGLTLGGLGTNISKAARSKDDDTVFYLMKDYCEQNGRSHMLDADVVVKYQMVGKLRNQSAHQNAMNRNSVEQIKTLVRDVLRAQQQTHKGSEDPAASQPMCAVIGADLKDEAIFKVTNNLQKHLYDEIDVFYQSGIYHFLSVGCTKFDLFFAHTLMKYRRDKIKQETADAERKNGKKNSTRIRAYSIKLTLIMPCELQQMKISDGYQKIIAEYIKDKRFSDVEVLGSVDNEGARALCLREALKSASFGIAYFDETSDSPTVKITKEKNKQSGIALWNGFGIE